jgi:hypothetical protein
MFSTSRTFEAAARANLANDNLQRALRLARGAPKKWRVALRAGQETGIGWIGAVRPFERPLSRPPQDDEFLNAMKGVSSC